MRDRNIKLTVVTATILLVAWMAGADPLPGEQESTVTKFCDATTYKETCMKSVSKATSEQPKDLLKAAFNTAVDEIQIAMKNTALYKRVWSDKLMQGALNVCEQTLNSAVWDLRRSFEKVDEIQVTNLKSYIADLRNWLTATSTNRETCVDAFQNTTGDTGKKVKYMLTTANQLISNSLALINELEKFLTKVDLGAVADEINAQQADPSSFDIGAIADKVNTDQVNTSSFDLGAIADKVTAQQAIPPPDTAVTAEPEEDKPWYDITPITDTISDHAQRLLLGGESDDDVVGQGEESTHKRKLVGNTPDVIVAKDGSGKFSSIQEAINSLPKTDPFILPRPVAKRLVMLVKAGVYQEYITVPREVPNLTLVGEGPLKTIITGNKSMAGGIPTYFTATVGVMGDGFIAKDITFENTAPVSQAVAIRVDASSVFYNCHINGFQDTLYVYNYKQFYRQCRISGTVDFVFGNAVAVFQKCDFVVRKHPGNGECEVTAQGREKANEDGVIVIQGGTISAEPEFLNAGPIAKAFLGRPWKQFSRTIVMQANIGVCIQPEGWQIWLGSTHFLNTLFYAEWGNTGRGSDLTRRPTWPGYQKNFQQVQAEAWTPKKLFVDDSFIIEAGVPYDPGFLADAPAATAGKQEL